jgi:hypothetical protein
LVAWKGHVAWRQQCTHHLLVGLTRNKLGGRFYGAKLATARLTSHPSVPLPHLLPRRAPRLEHPAVPHHLPRRAPRLPPAAVPYQAPSTEHPSERRVSTPMWLEALVSVTEDIMVGGGQKHPSANAIACSSQVRLLL